MSLQIDVSILHLLFVLNDVSAFFLYQNKSIQHHQFHWLSLTSKCYHHIRHHAFYHTHFTAVKSLNYLVFSDYFSASLLFFIPQYCFICTGDIQVLIHWINIPSMDLKYVHLPVNTTEIIHCSLYAKKKMSSFL